MTHFKVLVRGGMDSSIPQDAFVNTWHCDALNLPAGYEDFVDDLEIFYRTVDASMSSLINPAAITATVYNMTDPTPRAPVYSKTFTSITTSTTTLPPEVALCLSFQGERVSGQSQARRRGRVYIGPLGQIQGSTTTELVSSSAVAAVVGAAQVLLAASQASPEYDWCVYSTVDQTLVEVDNGWVDNAFDIQRRRGTLPASRSTW